MFFFRSVAKENQETTSTDTPSDQSVENLETTLSPSTEIVFSSQSEITAGSSLQFQPVFPNIDEKEYTETIQFYNKYLGINQV